MLPRNVLHTVQINNSLKSPYGNPPQSHEASLAIWDLTVLPAIRHKRTRPALTPARHAGVAAHSYLL